MIFASNHILTDSHPQDETNPRQKIQIRHQFDVTQYAQRWQIGHQRHFKFEIQYILFVRLYYNYTL